MMVFSSAHPKSRHWLSMPKLFSGLLLTILLVTMSCFDLPTDPNKAENSKINILLQSSDGAKSEDKISDTVGNEITVFVILNYPQYIKNIKVVVLDNEDSVVFRSDTFSTSTNVIDTIDIKVKLSSVKIEKIVTTANLNNFRRTDTAFCAVFPRSPSTIKEVPKFTVTTKPKETIIAGELCTLSVTINNPEVVRNYSTTVQRMGMPISPVNNEYIWSVFAHAVGYDTLIVTVYDISNPKLFAIDTTIVAINYVIPEIPLNLSVASRTLDSITLAWESSSRAESYQLLRSNNSTSGFKIIKDSIKETKYTDTLTAQPQYYQVIAQNRAGSSDPSTAISSEDDINTPPQWDITDTLRVTLAQGETYSLALTDTCVEPQGDPITFSLPPNALVGNSIEGTTYTCNPGTASGTFITEIIAKDPQGLSSTLTIKFTITPNAIVDKIPPVIDFVNITSDHTVVTTSSTALHLTITDESGIAEVQCTNGTVDYVVTPSGASTYACAITGLVEGVDTKITIVATDKAVPPNTTTTEVYFKYDPYATDNTGPVIELKAPAIDGETVGSSSITVKVTCTDDPSGVASVTCSFGDKTLPVAAGTDNIYSVDVMDLVAGPNTLTFIAVDNASSANSTTQNFTINYDPTLDDKEGPIITLTSPATSGERISTPTASVVVTCTDRSKVASVTCSFGDNALEVTAGAEGTYSVNVAGLAIGENILTFAATDGSSNNNKSEKSVIINYDPTMTDKTPPVIALQIPEADRSIVSDPSVTVGVKCTDINGIGLVTCTFGGAAVPVTEGALGSYTANVTGLAVGENSITFTAADGSTNKNKATFNVTVIHDPTIVDNVPPVITLKNPAKSGTRLLEDNITIQLDVTDAGSGIASVTCTRGGVSVPMTNVESLFSAAITALTPGKDETFTFVATDKSTNANSAKLEVTVQFNTPIGAIALAAPENEAAGVAYTPTFTWTGGDDPDGDPVFFKVRYGTKADALTKETSEKTERTATLSAVNSLTPFTTYYWQVVAYSKANEDTKESEVRSFTTQGVAPAITKTDGLKDQTLSVGKTLTLGVEASGTPAPTFQWYHNDVKIPGATSDTYQKPAATVDDAGSYYVVITNGVGPEVTSKKVTITLITLPSIGNENQPKSQNVTAGGDVAFEVTAEGSGPFTFQWKKDGIVLEGETDSKLTIKNVTPQNNGKYTVTVTNASGSIESNGATLDVRDPLKLTKQPSGKSDLKENDKLVLTAEATGSPAPQYQWYHEGSKLTSQTEATLTINKVTPDDAGSYHVVVSNGVDNNIISNTIKVTVSLLAVAPSITTDPKPITVKLGEEAEFKVVASGTAPLKYQWQKNDKDISGETGATYTISKTTTDDDQDKFSCVVSNSAGTVTSEKVKLTLLYSVKYDANGGTKTPADGKTYEKGKIVTLSSSKPVRDGYTFEGWSTKDGGSVEYDAGDSYTMGAGNVVFHAIWKAIPTYALTITAANGEITRSPDKDVYTAGEEVTLSVIADAGWEFTKWSGDISSTLKTITITMNGSKSVVANFSKITYTLTTSVIGDGTISVTPSIGPYPKDELIQLTATSATGWKFIKWVGDVSGSENPLEITMDDNKSITANFEKDTYTVTFEASGATNGSYPIDIKVQKGQKISNLAAEPKRKYYAFSGWYTSEDGQGTPFTVGSVVNSDITVYAYWLIRDADGNIYTTVTIGNQTWMVENLKTTKFFDGTSIPHVSGTSTWTSQTSAAYCKVGNTSSTYGLLYNSFVATSGKKLAPDGWRVPTAADFETLKAYLSANSLYANSLATKTGWVSSNTIGSPGYVMSSTNSTGFSAYPNGFRKGNDGVFNGTTISAMFWSSDDSDLNSGLGLGRIEAAPMTCGQLYRRAILATDGLNIRLIQE